MKQLVVKKADLDTYLLDVCSSVLLFFYVYTPKFIYLPLNFGYVSLVIAVLYFSLGTNVMKLLELFRSRIFLTFIYFYFFWILYAIAVLIFSTEKNNNIFLLTYLRLLPDIVITIPFFVILYTVELQFNLDRFLHKLLMIGVVQGVIAVAMVAVPPLKDITFAYIFQLPSDKLEGQAYRGFGASSDFYFAMPLFQAIVFAINTKFFIEKGKKYLLYYPFILVSMLANARTSVVIIPVLFIVIFIMSFYYDDLRWLRKLSSLVVSGFLMLLLIGVYFVLNPAKLAIVLWILNGLVGAAGALTGTGQSVTLNIILAKHWHFPHGWEALTFGKGEIVFENPDAIRGSDLGYVRYIYYGGFLLSALVYFNIYNFAKMTIRLVKDNFIKILLISITASLFIAQFKGDVVNSSPFFKGVLLIQIFIIYQNMHKGVTQ